MKIIKIAKVTGGLTMFIWVILGSCHRVSKEKQVAQKVAPAMTMDIWYGKKQTFGQRGNPQRWVNILGNIQSEDSIIAAKAVLNDSLVFPLSLGQDNHRLARKGDFNVEIDRAVLARGSNQLQIYGEDIYGNTVTEQIELSYVDHKNWPLPYTVDWKQVEHISDVVQIVDGKWKLTPEGVRTVEPYYDRVLAFGDDTWRNYEIETTVTFHDYASPLFEPPTYGVSHAAIAFRWPGHDLDKAQPHLKWYPLGATCEFKLFDNLDTCRFRILGGRKKANESAFRRQKIALNKKYHMLACAQTVGEKTYYAAKLWPFKETEPEGWDIISVEGETDVPFGSGLLLSHNTDVTFGNIMAREIGQPAIPQAYKKSN